MTNENTENIIEVENLCCLSGSQYLLNNINWKVKGGEQWVVFGRNGCGKTTLLSIIAGYKSFSSGTVKVFGQEYTKDNILDIRKRIGWVSSSFFDKTYQQEAVFDIVISALTGAMGRDFHVSNKDIAKARLLLERLGLKTKIDASFATLSKGERQNVLIARVFMTNPEIMILDEPATGLDVLAREVLLATIKELAEDQNTTMIYVTHYPEEILPSFDKCLLLRNGATYKIGPTKDLFNSEQMSDFLSYPVQITPADGRYAFAIQSAGLEF